MLPHQALQRDTHTLRQPSNCRPTFLLLLSPSRTGDGGRESGCVVHSGGRQGGRERVILRKPKRVRERERETEHRDVEREREREREREI